MTKIVKKVLIARNFTTEGNMYRNAFDNHGANGKKRFVAGSFAEHINDQTNSYDIKMWGREADKFIEDNHGLCTKGSFIRFGGDVYEETDENGYVKNVIYANRWKVLSYKEPEAVEGAVEAKAEPAKVTAKVEKKIELKDKSKMIVIPESEDIPF